MYRKIRFSLFLWHALVLDKIGPLEYANRVFSGAMLAIVLPMFAYMVWHFPELYRRSFPGPARPFFQESGPQRPIRLSALLLGRTETEWRLLLADAGRLASMFDVSLQNAGTVPSPILPANADYAEMMARQVAPMADVYVYFLDQKHGNILRDIEARTDQTAHDRDTETLAFAYMGRRVIYMLGRTGDGAAQDLLHELGHVMMLEHHERRNDIMFWCAGQYRLSFSPDFEYRLKYWNFR